MTEPILAVVPADHAPSRLDKWLAENVTQLSRTRLQALILNGYASIDKTTTRDPAAAVKPGQHIALVLPPPVDAELKPQAIPLAILFEDNDLIVLDKPIGLVVHPAPGHSDGTLANALLHHCQGRLSGIGGVKRPGIVHRIDKNTSGLLAIAKSDLAHQGLAQQFAHKTTERVYLALAWGRPRPSHGVIEGEIGRNRRHRQKMAVVGKNGRHALTRYRVVRDWGNGAVSMVECHLDTGRTHQIRVHMSFKGHALIGDALYGKRHGRASLLPKAVLEALRTFPRQALHAAVLGFTHPLTSQPLRFQSPLPADMKTLIDALDTDARGSGNDRRTAATGAQR